MKTPTQKQIKAVLKQFSIHAPHWTRMIRAYIASLEKKSKRRTR